MKSKLCLTIGMLVIACLLAAPVFASTVPVTDFTSQQVGTLTFTIIPDKTVYYPGDKITYKFATSSTVTDPNVVFSIENTDLLHVTLDNHLTGITVDTGNIGIQCTLSGNDLDCLNVNANQVLWLLDGNYYPQISGIIKPGTPSGTKITTDGYVGVSLDFNQAQYSLPDSAPDTNVISVVSKPITSPEFPSIFLPAILIIGLLGAVLLIKRT
jgi:hypothetical protein